MLPNIIAVVLFIAPFFLFTGDRKQYRMVPWFFAMLLMRTQPILRSLSDYVFQFFWFALLVGAVVETKKKPVLWFYCSSLPVVAGALWYYHAGYAGAINPQWPLVISAVLQLIAMYFINPKKTGWKIVANVTLVAIIFVIMTAGLPKYTYEAAKTKISGEISGDLIQSEQRETIYSIPPISPCVDHLYVFRFEEAGVISTFTFNPVTGERDRWDTN
ncbi:MAG TPA: hypothetical protein DDY38_08655 [Firmicutes bacterium]|jgi:asparagine N-glycosylation enzyme membrane subunit Stt3|nr:hypothetical protein [Bacillota bacterium]